MSFALLMRSSARSLFVSGHTDPRATTWFRFVSPSPKKQLLLVCFAPPSFVDPIRYDENTSNREKPSPSP